MKKLYLLAGIVLGISITLGSVANAAFAPISIPGGGTGTTTAPAGQLIYGGNSAYQSVATTTASCSGSASCTAFTIIGSSPITITASAGGGSFPFTPFTGYNATTTPLAFPGFISSASSTLSYLGSGLTGSFNGNLYAISTSSAVQMSITGLAGTATALATARAINGVNFDGTGPITINAASSTILTDANTWSNQTQIGIGTTTPWSLLSVGGAAAGTANLLAVSTSTATFATSTALMVDKNGNVGIATSTIAFPSVNLALKGNQYITGCLTINAISTAPCTTAGTFTLGAGATFAGAVTGISSLGMTAGLSGGTTIANSSTITNTLTSLATSTSIGDGLIETNSTAATNALNAQMSPRIRFTSNVYKAGVSTAGGFVMHSVPYATTSSPWVNWALTVDAFLSGTTYKPVFSINTGTSTDGIPYGAIGVGTTTPAGVITAAGYNLPAGSPLFYGVLSSGGGATTTAFKIDNVGHYFASSTNPVLSGCGTSPSLVGSDQHGTITVGATATGCTLTFGTAYPVAPTCVVSNQSMSVTNALTYTESATALTLSETGLGGALVDYVCFGN